MISWEIWKIFSKWEMIDHKSPLEQEIYNAYRQKKGLPNKDFFPVLSPTKFEIRGYKK